ncbi:MAG TPA: archaetidylserine decarboxylase [Longimicrobiales bacterium]|nr:archaetidylserine decarboxylase [Longimicrobiales bacterium]
MSESARPPAAFETFDAFFTRRLRPGVRSWPTDPSVAGSPVDGVVGRHGAVVEGRALQAKGRDYALAALLGDATEAAHFAHGSYLTIYLAPRHYHRVHAPVGGGLATTRHLPGRRMPVHAAAVALLAELFAGNERVACRLDADQGTVAVVAVGATNVGRIGVPAVPGWEAAAPTAIAKAHRPPIGLDRGDEMMVFHLGSTVVLLFDAAFRLDPGLKRGAEIRLGDPIARPA